MNSVRRKLLIQPGVNSSIAGMTKDAAVAQSPRTIFHRPIETTNHLSSGEQSTRL